MDLVDLARPEATLLSLGAAAIVVGTTVQLAIPIGFGRIVDATAVKLTGVEIVSPTTRDIIANMSSLLPVDLISSPSLMTISTGLGVMFLFGSVSSAARVQCFSVASARLVARLRRRLFSKLLAQPVAYFDSHRTGDLVTRLSNDVLVMSDALTGETLASGGRNALQLVSTLGIMLYISPQLSSVLLGVGPAVALSGLFYGRYVKKISAAVQASLGEASATAQDRLAIVRTVKAFNRENLESQLYNSRVAQVYQWNVKAATASSLFSACTSLVGNASLLAVLGYGSFLVESGLLSAGDLTSFLLFTLNFGVSIVGLSKFYGDFMRGVGASDRVLTLLHDTEHVPSGTSLSGVIPKVVDGRLVLNNVVFHYPTRPDVQILNGLSMTIEPGVVVALVGSSGSGKSTVAALLLKFYEPNSGSITLDGIPLDQIDTRWLRDNIGIVSQQPALFHGSIEENIQYGNGNATVDDIVAASKYANAHEFVQKLPNGYQTVIGQSGLDLSGGQMQRIAIARAVLKNPPILILDEATSALDGHSELLINAALEKLMANKSTTIVIAHRESTFRRADVIFLLRDGRIFAIGSHDVLRNDRTDIGSYYRNLIQSSR